MLYLRARVWHTAGAADEREADAQAFAKADAEAQRSARLPGRPGEYAEVGVLEAHGELALDGAQGRKIIAPATRTRNPRNARSTRARAVA